MTQTFKRPKPITIIVNGNPADPEGNAVPKLKMTGGQSWTEKAQRYVAWKAQVVAAAIDHSRGTDYEALVVRNVGIHQKPFTTRETSPARMDIIIYWANRAHGDPENIFGSLADALFKQDKYLIGSHDYRYSEEKKGRVEIKITLLNRPR